MTARILPQNEGAIDRVVRIALGVILLSLVFVGPETAWGYLGLLPLVTGILGTCPAYAMLGISTCPTRHA